MSISFTPSQSLLMAAVRAHLVMVESEGCSAWTVPACFLSSDSSIWVPVENSLVKDQRVLVGRAMDRFEREFGTYLVERKRGRSPVIGSLSAVRKYHQLLVVQLDILEELLDGGHSSGG